MVPEPKLILVPLDGSVPGEPALSLADSLASAGPTEIHLLYVSHRATAPDDLARRMRIPDEWLERVHLHRATGHAGPSIRRVARDLRASAILIPTHGHTADLRRAAGHVTLDVLSDPPCPVYVVRTALIPDDQAQRLRHVRRILVPLDGSPEAMVGLSQAVLLARASRATLHLLHVVAEDPSARRVPVAMQYADQPHHEFEAWEREFLRACFSSEKAPEGIDYEVTLRCGEPGEAIARVAAERDCDLIVTAWGGSLSAGRARVAQTLLGHAPCPIVFLLAHAA